MTRRCFNTAFMLCACFLFLYAVSVRAQQTQNLTVEAPKYNDGDWWRVRVQVNYFFESLTHSGSCHERYPEYVVKIENRQPKVYGAQGNDLEEIPCSIVAKQLLGFGIDGDHDESKGGDGDHPNYLHFPMAVGTSWGSRILQLLRVAGLAGGETHPFRWNFTDQIVVGRRTIKTPKGALDAFEIQVSGWRCFVPGGCPKPTYFYAPKAKAIVFFRWSFVGDMRIVRLIDYHLVDDESDRAAPQPLLVKESGNDPSANVDRPQSASTATPMMAEQNIILPAPSAPETKNVSSPPARDRLELFSGDQETFTARESAAPSSGPKQAAPQEIALVTKPAAAGANLAEIHLKLNVIGQRKEADGSYVEVAIDDGSVLRARDNFQLHLESDRPAYVYILIYDSEGKASQLFPDPKIDQSGFVEAGRKVTVPGDNSWFWLDDSAGTETIYVLASENPMTDIRNLLTKMQTADDRGQERVSQEIKERIGIMQRGVGGITKGQAATYTLSDGKKIQKVTDVVTGTGSVVRAVSFLHK